MICPHAAHIRKVNPRDDGTDTGGTNDTLARRILRRGIPYGVPLSDTATEADDPLKGNRGLLFISYQTSISDQFEFLVNRWTNQKNVPKNGGHDPVIGQNGKLGDNRSRQFEIALNDSPSETFSITREWVIPTGGGYFFAPSISALKNVLA
ncbi:MAG: Dyp-type peroxidase [Stigonema ocellatum SAG 48.90 = DSM 106950]|nr:Dyp-type peroxidase [Stigonema ocellatum SAG 48.90 = DSM 106950]